MARPPVDRVAASEPVDRRSMPLVTLVPNLVTLLVQMAGLNAPGQTVVTTITG